MIAVTSLTRTYANKWPAAVDAGTLRLQGTNEFQEGDLTIKPVLVSGNSAFGAEVSGVDWTRAVPENIVEQASI
jgi:alpha-ketoglutarate-dependent 2,4-dichlorophenoxyacetate dioxygenase